MIWFENAKFHVIHHAANKMETCGSCWLPEEDLPSELCLSCTSVPVSSSNVGDTTLEAVTQLAVSL